MRLIVTAEEARVLTNKVLSLGGDNKPHHVPGVAAVRVASLSAAHLGRLCGFEEIRIEVEKPPTVVERPAFDTYT